MTIQKIIENWNTCCSKEEIERTILTGERVGVLIFNNEYKIEHVKLPNTIDISLSDITIPPPIYPLRLDSLYTVKIESETYEFINSEFSWSQNSIIVYNNNKIRVIVIDNNFNISIDNKLYKVSLT